MAPLWSSQPFKALYTISFLLKSPLHVIILFLQYLVKPLRPLPEWNIQQNLSSDMLQMFFNYSTSTRYPYVYYTDPKRAKERLASVIPPDSHLFSGVLAPSQLVKPAPLEAIWYPSPPPQHPAEMEKQKVVLHFPGGAFVIAFGHGNAGINVADTMSRHMGATRTVWAQYRLSGTPETRFPAALQGAFTFYHYIVSLGVDPRNIILSGDSAGGNVVLALMRYLETLQPQLPRPGGAIVFSPWVHVTAQAAQDYDKCKNSRSDILVGSVLQWGADAYRPQGQLPSDIESYISPLHHPFKTSIPLFIQAGAVEAFHEPIKKFSDEMAAVNGDRVRLHTTALAPHDILLTHESFGMTEELSSAVKEACGFFGK